MSAKKTTKATALTQASLRKEGRRLLKEGIESRALLLLPERVWVKVSIEPERTSKRGPVRR